MGDVVILDDDPVVELAIWEAEEGTVTERHPREERWQRRLHARRGAPHAAYGTESDAGGVGWYAEEHEAPRHFRRVHADLARFGGIPRARAELADFLLGPVQ
jgi:hypothetical protein